MRAWRVLGAVVFLLARAPAGRAETYNLAEAVKAGDCFQLQLEMKLTGELRVFKGGTTVPFKLEATCRHTFPERVLAVGTSGAVEKTARVYEAAQAVIKAGEDRSERTLRPERRLVVVQRHKDQTLAYSPAGTLTREELDLTGGHFDTLALAGVLPGKAVAVGDTWKVPSGVVQALCNFEGLTEQALTGKLEGAQDQVATFSLTGTAAGIDLGALVKLTIQATGRFDLKTGRLVALDWKQKDERDQGPISPATVVESTTTLSRKVIEQPASLSDVALVSVPPDEVPGPMLQLDYRDPKGRFGLLHGREWHQVAATGEHVVLRLMDRGDFVAQVTLTPWTPAAKGKHLSPEEFKAAMNETSGWRPEKELQAGEVPSSDGHWVYRYSVLGQLDGVAVLQNFYLVAGPGGEQVVLAFTMTPKQVDKLGARDLSLVGSLEVPAPGKK
jgi:hypothetical protein